MFGQKMPHRFVSKTIASSVVLASALIVGLPSMALAAGGATGPKVQFIAPGKIGSIIVNPYGIAPLTAIIENGGYDIRNAKVTVEGKRGGQTISYKVADTQLKTHRGIPIFGLYADYKNQVSVEYDKYFNGKKGALNRYIAMQKIGKAWKFSAYNADGSPNRADNPTRCLNCHRESVQGEDIVFTLDKLKAFRF